MISYILLVISLGVVVLLYLFLLVVWFSNRRNNLDNYTGFDIAKEVITNYDSINIVSSNDIMFSEYDIKRNVIRLNNSNYDGNSSNDIVISALLAGYSLVNSDNPSNFKFSFIFKKIRVVSLVPLFMIVISYFVSNIGDAKIGIVLFLALLVYQYMRYQIAISANEFIKRNLKKNIYNKIEKSLIWDVTFNKLSFIVSLVMILRLVVIILGI